MINVERRTPQKYTVQISLRTDRIQHQSVTGIARRTRRTHTRMSAKQADLPDR